MKVSIIIPVYNTASYIRECLLSAKNQTLKDIEILIIDDGSTDDSLAICREFEKNDIRIKVFTQENSGVSVARNKGIKEAKGEYLYFLDSDDCILPRFAEVSYNIAHANNSDITICDKYLRTNKKGGLKRISNVATSLIFVKNEFLKQHEDILFPKGIIISEDGVFFTKIMTFAKNVSVNYEDLHFYRQHDRQNTKTVFKDINVMLEQIPKILKNLEEFFDKHNLWEKEYARFANCMQEIVYNWFEFENIKRCKEKREVRKQIKSIYKNKIEKYMTDEDKKYINYKFFLLINSKSTYLCDLRFKLSGNKIFHWLYTLKKILAKIFHSLKRFIQIRFKIIYNDEKRFIKNFLQNIDTDKALIVEANDFHHETLPGYVDYFNQLGIDCDVLATSKTKKMDVFFNNSAVNVHYTRGCVIWELLKKPEIKKYKCVFVASNYIDLLKKSAADLKNLADKNVIITAHNLRRTTPKMLKNYNISCLNVMGREYLKNNVINPHYFTEISHPKKNKTVRFLIAGRVKNSRFNYEAIYDAISKLKCQNIFNYKVVIVGAEIEKVDSYLANEINLDYLEPLDFKTLYKEIEKADFLLTPFDPEIKSHNRYLNDATSGHIQLSYGFLKPTIIHRTFANNFGFNETNSLLFDDCENLDETIKTAIQMSNDEYKYLRQNLKILKDKIYDASLQNLKNFLNK